MSGPKTAQYTLRVQRKQAEERKRREDMARRLVVANANCLLLEKRIERLKTAIGELKRNYPMESVDILIPPFTLLQTNDPATLEDYVAKIQGELSRAEVSLNLLASQAKVNQNFRKALQSASQLSSGIEQTADDVFQRFMEMSKSNTSSNELKERRAELDRILGRFINEEWKGISPKMESLAVEAMTTGSGTRFSALTTELRHQVHKTNKEATSRIAEIALATKLLTHLESEVPFGADRFKQQLELVKVGAFPLPAGFENQLGGVIAQAKHEEQLEMQEAASCIVRDALKDLGYDVTPIENTLFMDGGKAYFRKAGWNNYYVQLMVRPEENKLNFNVVKIDDQADEHQPSVKEDIEAENAWCSGYNQLMDTFKARGLEMELIRHLPVGKVPVPHVNSEEVHLTSIDQRSSRRKLINSKLKSTGSKREKF